MGLPNWQRMGDLDLVSKVQEGFHGITAVEVFRKIDRDEKIVKVTDVIPKSTLHRYMHKPLPQEQSEKVLAMSKLFSEVLRIYHNNSQKAAAFLVKDHPMLGNQSPIVIATGSIAGVDLVMKILAQADAGVAV